mmetsp:Transcript_31170/g.98974  ORF Transcript_31170/g.98974 Transcript_31170/m.98974 type:complete len:265 (+) Transcript_31170:2264-3058(+)
MSASGTLQMIGMMMQPASTQPAPPAPMASSKPKGPPLTLKKMRQARPATPSFCRSTTAGEPGGWWSRLEERSRSGMVSLSPSWMRPTRSSGSPPASLFPPSPSRWSWWYSDTPASASSPRSGASRYSAGASCTSSSAPSTMKGSRRAPGPRARAATSSSSSAAVRATANRGTSCTPLFWLFLSLLVSLLLLLLLPSAAPMRSSTSTTLIRPRPSRPWLGLWLCGSWIGCGPGLGLVGWRAPSSPPELRLPPSAPALGLPRFWNG